MCAISEARSKPRTSAVIARTWASAAASSAGGEDLVDLRERGAAARLAAREADQVAAASRQLGGGDREARDIGGASGERLGDGGRRDRGDDGEDRDLGELVEVARLGDEVRGLVAGDDHQRRRIGRGQLGGTAGGEPGGGELGQELGSLLIAASEHDDGCAIHALPRYHAPPSRAAAEPQATPRAMTITLRARACRRGGGRSRRSARARC
jgi:hypothetical protein